VTIPEVIAVGLGGVALIAVIVLALQVSRVNRQLSAIPADGNVFEALRRLDADLSAAEQAIARLQPVVQSLSDRMPGAIRHTAVVTYDAHHDLAGNLSRSIALLNERGDGLVLTLMVGRNESIYYTKMVRGGRGVEPLSPEEASAVKAALKD
jgi:hypothetical protein